ncbi:hypothetical protein ACQEV9_15565 [Streptomyces chartreusis]|uniref:hypothetical protein n=1 Tax=Streptomyces chartreusis TaxID=1969 RepID=UPI003D8ADE49
MAKKNAYIVAHPNGETTERFEKGGKVPAYALWMDLGNGWELSGSYSYGDSERATKAAEQKARIHGGKFLAARVIPCQP